MKGILDFFESIKDGIVTAYQFLVGLIEDIAYMVEMVGKFVAKIPSYFEWLPKEILAIVLVGFAIVVVYKILGREG